MKVKSVLILVLVEYTVTIDHYETVTEQKS